MIKLSKVTIHNYKCIEDDQCFDVEDDVTVLVGMNESGKTTVLEAIAKCNYFEIDSNFKFNSTFDYPRRRLKGFDKGKESDEAVTLEYQLSDDLIEEINESLNIICGDTVVSVTYKYDGSTMINIHNLLPYSRSELLAAVLDGKGVDNELLDPITSLEELNQVIERLRAGEAEEENICSIELLRPFYENSSWDNPFQYYAWSHFVEPNLPVFMYYDEYYSLPAKISLEGVKSGNLDQSSLKTAHALLELADVNLSALLNSNNYEEYIAELEATQADISDSLFQYWKTNDNLGIEFSINKIEGTDNRNGVKIVNHELNIRVKNHRNRVSLPLDKRSKGFNWFFSFLVWFKKIQEDDDRTYILLLDEPGLNLHAMAQYDLLRFIDDLSENYQVIYTTHSPFMIESNALNRVRTVYEQKTGGTLLSDSLQEKDPNTMFPLQAALGYSVAQNLFISKNNLIVEGIADLAYLEFMSALLGSLDRIGLSNKITIVPSGGADKVATFVSLMRGNDLNMVCLLDTFTDQSPKKRLENLVAEKIIAQKNILYYQEFTGSEFADVEDLFEKAEYLDLYNAAFDKHIKLADIDESKPIMGQLKRINGGKNFNHYLPANYLVSKGSGADLSEETLDRFERLFKHINKLF